MELWRVQNLSSNANAIGRCSVFDKQRGAKGEVSYVSMLDERRARVLSRNAEAVKGEKRLNDLEFVIAQVLLEADGLQNCQPSFCSSCLMPHSSKPP